MNNKEIVDEVYPYLGRPLDEYDESEIKECTSCGEQKLINQIRPYMNGFSKRNSGSKDGYRAQCKSCHNQLRFENSPEGRKQQLEKERAARKFQDPELAPPTRPNTDGKSAKERQEDFDNAYRNCTGWKHVRRYYEERTEMYRKAGIHEPMPEVGCNGKPLRLTEFHKNAMNKYGVGTVCKWCKAELELIAIQKALDGMETSPMTPDDIPLREEITFADSKRVYQERNVEIND